MLPAREFLWLFTISASFQSIRNGNKKNQKARLLIESSTFFIIF